MSRPGGRGRSETKEADMTFSYMIPLSWISTLAYFETIKIINNKSLLASIRSLLIFKFDQ